MVAEDASQPLPGGPQIGEVPRVAALNQARFTLPTFRDRAILISLAPLKNRPKQTAAVRTLARSKIQTVLQ
jgi:hypothetical protein